MYIRTHMTTKANTENTTDKHHDNIFDRYTRGNSHHRNNEQLLTLAYYYSNYPSDDIYHDYCCY